jgi:hypothetical protein
MARRKRSLISWMILLGVLTLAAVGGYHLYNSDTGQATERVVKEAVKAGHRQAVKETE